MLCREDKPLCIPAREDLRLAGYAVLCLIKRCWLYSLIHLKLDGSILTFFLIWVCGLTVVQDLLVILIIGSCHAVRVLS